MIAKAVYPVTPSLIEWLNNNEKLLPIEADVFQQWRDILPLVRLVEATVLDHVPRFVAEQAIAQHNDLYDTNFTYEEILGRASDYMFAGVGGWACYTDNQEAIIFGRFDDYLDAFDYTPGIEWAVVWWPFQDTVVVHRSPHVQNRAIIANGYEEGGNGAPLCDGMDDGRNDKFSVDSAFTLPPEIEAAVLQDSRRQCT